MILRFYGTRGDVEEFSDKHKYNSSLLLEYKNFKLLIDYGEIHKNINEIKPDSILITHAHPDHAFGLKESIKIPVYLTEVSYDYIKNFPIENPKIIKINKEFEIGPFKIKAANVIHSLRCPTFCFKIKVNEKCIVYAPDLIDIENKEKFLEKVDLYIGDGASVNRGLVRRKGNKLFGHTSIKTQINWAKKFNIKEVIFTHFGKEAIELSDEKLKEKLKEFSEGIIDVKVAYDGMVVEI